MLLLLGHRAEARLALGLVAGLLDLALPDRLDARLLLALALLLLTTTLVLARACGPLRPRGRGARHSCASVQLGGFLALLVVVLLLDAIFLKAHQLLEGEENGALFLFRHCQLLAGVRS